MLQDIIKELVVFDGIFQRIFGSDYDNVTKKIKIQRIRHILKDIYGYEDADDCLVDEIDEIKMKKAMNTVFRFYDTEKKSFLNFIKKENE